MKLAVVGHVEWVDFAVVERVPEPGEIVHVREAWEEPAGGGAVAAVQLARLSGGCLFVTALGDDDRGHRAKRDLEAMGVEVRAAWRSEPQRRAFVYLDASGERTITVIGERLTPRAEDPLPWPELERCDGIYLTAGDPGAVRAARAARCLVATVRALPELNEAGVEIDALVSSANDDGERYSSGDLESSPRMVVRTDGAGGGELVAADGSSTRWPPASLPGPVIDSYGAGDSFVAGFTYGLADGLTPEAAVSLGARCGAACVTGRGPYRAQIGAGPDAPGL
jgi:ribokinase